MATTFVSTESFKALMARWASGVTVVTVRDGEQVHGMTVSSFASVSADPPLILVCLYRGTRTRDYIARRRCFAVNILDEHQQAIAERFAGRRGADESPFQGVSWHFGPSQCPLLDDAAAHIECRVDAVHEAGTHTIFIGCVESAHLNEQARPLVYWYRAFRQIDSQ